MDAMLIEGLARRLEAGETLTGRDLDHLGADTFGTTTLGLVWDELSRDRAVAHLDPGPQHHQPHGIVHGGVWCSVIESVASIVAAIRAFDIGEHVVGVSNSTDFLRPHETGRVEAVAEPIHVGRSQQLWQVVIHRVDDGKDVARGQVRLQHVAPRPI